MNDAAFAALERRLAPVLAEGGRGVIDRHDVLDLLAECRALRDELGRMRLPPDVAGLMTEAELEALRAKVCRFGAGTLPRWIPALFGHADALQSLVRELYGVVTDLHADDPGRQALLEHGRAEGREQAARAVAERHLNNDSCERAVRALGPCRPPLPPHVAEAEAGRLREALSAVVAARDGYDRYEASLNEVYKAIDFARAALAENSR